MFFFVIFRQPFYTEIKIKLIKININTALTGSINYFIKLALSIALFIGLPSFKC